MTATGPSEPPPAPTIHDNFGFPAGYFVIRSLANGRLLDVEADSTDDGAEIILWPEKDTSLVESFRSPESNNQVFFIDVSGALCSRDSGHAIDIEDGRLILRHRRPVSHPFPNAYSHPLPTFHYTATTGDLTATFAFDPAYPRPPAPPRPGISYHLTALPQRKPRTFLDGASDALTSALRSPLSLFGAPRGGEAFDLQPEEVVETERGEDAEVDDAPDPLRRVRVVGTTAAQARGLGERARKRRQWKVLPLRTVAARTGP